VNVRRGLVTAILPPYPPNEPYNFTFDLIPKRPELKFLNLLETHPKHLVLGVVFAATEAVAYECATMAGQVGGGMAVAGVESRFTFYGLQPLTTYQVQCTARLRDRPRVESELSSPKFTTTCGDENTHLADLNITATPMCDGEPAGEARIVFFFPVFDPEHGAYESGISADEHPKGCADDTDQTWRLQVQGKAESQYARVEGSTNDVTLRGTDLVVKETLKVLVYPLTSTKIGVYNVTVAVANFEVRIQSVSFEGEEASEGIVEVKERGEFTVVGWNVHGIAMELDTVSMDIGVYTQVAPFTKSP
jgi:hypothetical protein